MSREPKATVRALLEQDKDLLRDLIQVAVQQVLEAEMTEQLGAAKSERAGARRGYRSGYYERGLITRVGRIELRVPQDREGRFSTEVFERGDEAGQALDIDVVADSEDHPATRDHAARLAGRAL